MPSRWLFLLAIPTLAALPFTARAQSPDTISRPLTGVRHLVTVKPIFSNPWQDKNGFHVGGLSIRTEHRLTEGFTLGVRASLYSTHRRNYYERWKSLYLEGGVTARYYFARQAPRGFYAEWGLYAGEDHSETLHPLVKRHYYHLNVSPEFGAGYQWLLFRRMVVDVGMRLRMPSFLNRSSSPRGINSMVGLGVAF